MAGRAVLSGGAELPQPEAKRVMRVAQGAQPVVGARLDDALKPHWEEVVVEEVAVKEIGSGEAEAGAPTGELKKSHSSMVR